MQQRQASGVVKTPEAQDMQKTSEPKRQNPPQQDQRLTTSSPVKVKPKAPAEQSSAVAPWPFSLFTPPGGLPMMDVSVMEWPLMDWSKKLFENRNGHSEAPHRGNRTSSSETKPPNSPLICMRAEGGRTPFFCVHALLGSTFHFFALANLLSPEQPFYALQAPGLDGEETAVGKIEDLAAFYLHYIREVQPKGPYRLGGYSFGGLVSLEMARQLTEAGEEVSHLIIFGTDTPLSSSLPKQFEILGFIGQYWLDFHKNIVMPFFSYEKRVAWERELENIGFAPKALHVAGTHSLAAMRYNPRPYSGRITLLETLEQQLSSPLDPSRGWHRLAAGGVESMLVTGNHLSMLDEPHVRDLADKLNLLLAKP